MDDQDAVTPKAPDDDRDDAGTAPKERLERAVDDIERARTETAAAADELHDDVRSALDEAGSAE